MQDFIIALINQYGYWGVGFLLVIENFILFIPSEIKRLNPLSGQTTVVFYRKRARRKKQQRRWPQPK